MRILLFLFFSWFTAICVAQDNQYMQVRTIEKGFHIPGVMKFNMEIPYMIGTNPKAVELITKDLRNFYTFQDSAVSVEEALQKFHKKDLSKLQSYLQRKKRPEDFDIQTYSVEYHSKEIISFLIKRRS